MKVGQLIDILNTLPKDAVLYPQVTAQEGFWYWTMTGRDELRNLLGWECKSKGRELENVRTHPTKEELKEAYLAKLEAHPDIKLRLMFNSLPLAHYYVYNGKVVEPQEWQWTAKLWEEIKIELR